MKKKKQKIIILGSNGMTGTCELCGAKNEDLRPYGPRGEYICFDCGMKNEASTDREIRKFLDGDQ